MGRGAEGGGTSRPAPRWHSGGGVVVPRKGVFRVRDYRSGPHPGTVMRAGVRAWPPLPLS